MTDGNNSDLGEIDPEDLRQQLANVECRSRRIS